MTGIFRANNPLNSIILLLYGLLLKFPYFSERTTISDVLSDGYLPQKLADTSLARLDQWPFIYPAVAFLLLYIQAVILNYFVNSQKMINKPGYLTAMSYLLVTSLFPEWNKLSSVLIVSTLLLGIIGGLLLLGGTNRPRSSLFNMGLVVGICSFFYIPSVLFLLTIILSLTITRPPKLAEWIMAFLGFIAVWYFLMAFLFITNRLYGFGTNGMDFDLPDLRWTAGTYIAIGITGLLFLGGVLYQQGESLRQPIQIRRRWSVLLAGTVITLFLPFFNKTGDFSPWLPALSFLTPFIGIVFYYIKPKKWASAIQWGVVALVIYLQYIQ